MTDKNLTNNEIIKTLEGAILNAKGCDSKVWSIEIYKLENALNLITHQQAELENLKVENQSLRSAANSLKMHYEEAQAEIERLQSVNDEKFRQWDMLAEKTKQHYANLYEEAKDILKAEAYKECIEKVRKLAVGMHPCSDELRVFDSDLDNLLKMVGEIK